MKVAIAIWRDPLKRSHQFFLVEVKPDSWYGMKNASPEGVTIVDAMAAVDDFYSDEARIPDTISTSFIKIVCESFAVFDLNLQAGVE